MAIQISGTNAIDNTRKGLFQSANIGTFTPANRPGSASTGDIIYNTSTAQMEVWNGSSWVRACGANATEISATGGTIITSPDGTYVSHYFTSPGTFTLNTPTAYINYFVVAGGGGGCMGGGGAGGLLDNLGLGSAVQIAAGSFTVTVGAGGVGAPGFSPPTSFTDGGPSHIPGILPTPSIGGGRSNKFNVSPGDGFPGGSGGGAGFAGGGGAGTPGQGFPGGPSSGYSPRTGTMSGGGGGARGAGQGGVKPPTTNPGVNQQGGEGYTAPLTFTPPSYGHRHPTLPGVVFARGGAGGPFGVPPAYQTTPSPTSGNGGPGGSDGGALYPAASGASGIVIIRYIRYQ